MSGVRYAQFCPLARAAEVLGERWTLLVVRELFRGPRRFADLRSGLPGVSPSVLSDRLRRLEERGVVRTRTLPPPAASRVYELDEAGRALLPALAALARWGARFLFPMAPGEAVEPGLVPLALRLFARGDAVPSVRLELRMPDPEAPDGEVVCRVAGGPEGTHVEEGPGPADAVLRAAPLVVLGLMAGRVDPAEARRDGRLRVEGRARAAARLPALFEVDTGAGTDPAAGVPVS